MRPVARRRLGTAAWLLIVAGLVTGAAVVAVLTAPGLVGAEESYVVLSGSMAPAIETGDVVVVRAAPADAVEVGDVVTVRRPDAGPAGLVTHRVVERRETSAGAVFETKGDANDASDGGTVAPAAIVGTVWFVVPAVGRIALFVASPLGLSLSVLLPGLWLVASGARELYAVVRAPGRPSLDVADGATDPATGVLRGRFTGDGRVRDLSAGTDDAVEGVSRR